MGLADPGGHDRDLHFHFRRNFWGAFWRQLVTMGLRNTSLLRLVALDDVPGSSDAVFDDDRVAFESG